MTEKKYPTLSSATSLPPAISSGFSIPHPLDGEWHVNVDDAVYGPFTGHDLKKMVAEGRVEYDSLVQKVNGPNQWIKAADDRALSKFFTPKPESQTPSAPSVVAGDKAQVVTVNNNISAPPAYLGEKPVDKSPFLAAVLSLLIVGVGQMYNGQVGKGILMMIGCVLLWTVMLGWIVNLWSIGDAYSVAKRKHDAYHRWMAANAAAARAQDSG